MADIPERQEITTSTSQPFALSLSKEPVLSLSKGFDRLKASGVCHEFGKSQ